MKLLALLFVIFGLATAMFAGDLQNFSITTNQVAEVKQKLEAFDKGTISLDEITTDRNAEWARALIIFYLSNSNDVTTKMKLPISRCLAGFDKYPEALQLSRDYVSVYSNDWHGWRIIGAANYLLGDFNASVNAYTNAVRLGDDGSCAKLAIAAMKTDQDNLVRDMVPHLLALKNSKPKDKTVRPIEIEGALLFYSLRTNQKDIFVRALEGVDPKDIIAHEDLTTVVNQGCKQFKGKDIDKIRQQMESVPSSTNSVSSPSH